MIRFIRRPPHRTARPGRFGQVMDINEQPILDRAARATADISLATQIEVTTRPSSADQNLVQEADQEDLVHRPSSAEDRLISLQARLLRLEQLNSRLKHLKKDNEIQQNSRGQSLSSETDSDIFLGPRESATIHSVHGSSLVSAVGIGRSILLQTGQTPIEEWKHVRGDGRHTGHRASFKIEPENARGGSHSRDENFNPSSIHEDLCSEKTSAVERNLGPEHSRPPDVQNDTLDSMKKIADLRHSSRSLNVNSRSAARFHSALH
jgi:hypothetical protein